MITYLMISLIFHFMMIKQIDKIQRETVWTSCRQSDEDRYQREMKDGYELEIDLPGFKKDEVTAELNDGYLTVSAAKGLDQDEQEKETGKYIRRERYAGACQRSYYVGEDITEEDIKAEFKHGILKLFVPKKEVKPAVEEKKYISIEG